ncbi:MAG: HAD-IC family P-type ATPase [Chloroflexi bacterium]|nr:HAD-IC family P-type ATPase [Chloroflexota bacterium]
MKKTDAYKNQKPADTLKELGVDRQQGLSDAEVQKRLQQYGTNEIEEKEEPLWHRIFRRFWGPIPWMIEIAAILSAVVRKWEDFIIILIMLFVNAFLDFYQEGRALNALKSLKQKITQQTIVLRNGEFKTIPARELVPGDIIKLKIGDIVPADVQLLDGDYIQVDQSALTGESLPVNKKPGDVAYSNTVVKQGEILAVVVNTGMNTNFTQVVSLVALAQREETSHFQKMVILVGDYLILLTVSLVLIIIMVGMFRQEDILELIRYALVLTVAAIPVAMPAVLSVVMAVGALDLAKKQAIVSRLVAIEELAGVDTLCSDKTGTLTLNKLQVTKPTVFNGHSEQELLLVGVLASKLENKDPIDLAIFDYMNQKYPDQDWKSYQQKHFIPFDPIRKRTEAEIEKGDEHFTAIKGAPQVVIDLANLPDDEVQKLTDIVDSYASKGYRTIAVAKKRDDEVDLIGLIPLLDPPRTDSKAVIEDLHQHGVRVKMITGDNIAIAKEIGLILGLTGPAMRARELHTSQDEGVVLLTSILSKAIYAKLYPNADEEAAQQFAQEVVQEVESVFDASALSKGLISAHESDIIAKIEETEIFAEVVPEDKFLIVKSLQKANHIVAMTGDGVNDAPALKKADCGIAVANATDAARSASDIILTTPGLGVINDAIKLSRTIFERMKSYTTFRVAETIRIIFFMTLSIVVFHFYPITALMIIILALLNDIPIMTIAYDNTKVDTKPVRWNMKEMLAISTVLGIAGLLSSFFLFFLLEELHFSTAVIQSLLFAKLVIAGHGTIYNTRIDTWFWKKPHPSWTLFGATFSTRILGTLFAVYGWFMVSIGWKWALLMWAYALLWFVFNDAMKMLTLKWLRSRRGQAYLKSTTVGGALRELV